MENINNRLTNTQPFGRFVNFYIPGRWYGTELLNRTINSNANQAINTMLLAHFTTFTEVTIDTIAVINNSSSASAVGKIVIYRDDFENTGNYLPSVLMYESAELSYATTGAKETPANFTFYPGFIYYLGHIAGGVAVSMRRLVVAMCINYGNANGQFLSTSNYRTFRYDHTYTNPLPTTLIQSDVTVQANINPLNIRFQVV